MENRKFVKFLAPIVFVGAFLIPNAGLAYSAETHAVLTEATFDFYNKNFSDNQITDELKDYMMDGARQEDASPRWLNHFYDPVYDRGLESAYGDGYKSKDWAVTSEMQNEAKYKITTALASLLTAIQQKNLGTLTTETDFTWQRAIRFWVNGEKEKAMYVLGHVLHLIQDASVPDHTRNDPHPGGIDYSPYEQYTSKLEVYSENLLAKVGTKKPVILGDLSAYFDGIATYSNNNFYSGDTIGIQSGYKNPQPINFTVRNDGYFYGVYRDSEGNEFNLVLKQSRKGSMIDGTIFNWIIDDDLILQDYWRLLSAQSIRYGAGVINLFFQEVEKAKNDPNFAKEEKEESESFFARVIDAVKDLFSKDESGVTIKEINLTPEELKEKIEKNTQTILREKDSEVMKQTRELEVRKKAEEVVKQIVNEETATNSVQEEQVVFPININTAMFEELQKITGIGPVLARRIIDYRNANGAFYYIEDIKKVDGIKYATFEKLKEQITVGNVTPPVNLGSGEGGSSSQNNATQEQTQEQNQNQEQATSTQPQIVKILINEVQLRPTDKRFIELYNPNDFAVDLTGWFIQRKTKTGSSFSSFVSRTNFTGKNIGPKEYFLISREQMNGSDIVLDSLTLTDSNVIQIKKQSGGEVVDKVGWGGAQEYEGASASNPTSTQSLQRKFINGAFVDTDNNSADFELRDCPSPKAREANCV